MLFHYLINKLIMILGLFINHFILLEILVSDFAFSDT